MTQTFDRRREFVNKEFGNLTRGRNISDSKKTKLLKMLWRQAKKKIN